MRDDFPVLFGIQFSSHWLPEICRMPSDRPLERRQKLLHNLKNQPVDALLVSNETNVSYLTGFTGDSSYLLIGKGLCILISDGRYTTQIAQECPGMQAYIRPQTETVVVAAALQVETVARRPPAEARSVECLPWLAGHSRLASQPVGPQSRLPQRPPQRSHRYRPRASAALAMCPKRRPDR
jgi:Xaa-Pro aminopeptidase